MFQYVNWIVRIFNKRQNILNKANILAIIAFVKLKGKLEIYDFLIR